MFFLSLINIYAQENNENYQLKIQLLESKLELLDLKLESIDNQWNAITKSIDSLLSRMQNFEHSEVNIDKSRHLIKKDTFLITNPKYIVYIDPERLFEGSLCLTMETRLKKNFYLDFGLMGTYVTREGFGSVYMKSQDFEYIAAEYANDSYYSYYSGEMITGFGIFLNGKKYLSPTINAPFGLYAGPQLMYRKVHFIGRVYYYDIDEYQDAVKNMDVFRGGVVLGGKTRIGNVLCLDVSVGGVIRLSKYYRDDSFTKYQSWHNIDYSGILPTLTVKLGILN
ncbi:MAG: hypothetical protein Kow0068_23160 [Marinilabiliales bacterium]